MEESKNTSKKVVMFPWLAHGHISPFLELAKKLADNNFTIFLCSSPVILQNVKPELPDHYSASIELVELNIPSSPELPPQMHTTNGLPLRLIPTLANALNMAAPDFSAILQKLNPDLLIFDIFQPWAAEIASSFHIPAILLFTFGYCTTALALHSVQSSDTKFPFPELTKPFNLKKRVDIPRKGGRILKCLLDLEHSSETILVNSFTEIEGDYMEYVSVLSKKKVLPIGPLVQKSCSEEDDESEILRWLDRKKPKSTVYVAFGSEYYLEKEDIVEIAHGLELSGVNFIWIVRFPKGERIAIEEALPDGFLERIGDRGIVIDEWAPQMKILGHSSVGAFLSHCGWNSVQESLLLGVPIISLPMHLDQPWNAMVAEHVGVCVPAERDGGGNIRRESVAVAIKEVVVEGRGEELRRKAREISEILKNKETETVQCLVAQLHRLSEARN